MTHANAPLSVEGRRCLIERCKDRPIAHVAAKMGISRACASKWVNRWRQHGELGLLDPNGESNHEPRPITARRPGHMVHIDVKKVGRIPNGGGSCYRADAFAERSSVHGTSESRRTCPATTARWRDNRILAEEFLYARTWQSEDQRCRALDVWNVHYNYHRPHGAAGGQPPVSRLRDHVTNVMASYT